MRSHTKAYFPAIDGLRAVSVLLVATSHIHGAGTFERLNGAMGVWIFFVLSGYLITSLLIQEEQSTGSVSLSAFYIRRSFRIFPVYYLILALYCVLVLGAHADPRRQGFVAALPYYLTYLQEIPHVANHSVGGAGVPFEISWSLGIEEKFYLVWPWLAFVLLSKRGQRFAIAVSLCVLTWGVGYVGGFGLLLAPYSFILLGCALALAQTARVGASTFSRLSGRFYPLLALLLVLAFPASLHGFVVALAVCLALPGLVETTSGVPRLLASRPLAWLGRISYGFYLTHQLGLNAAKRLLHGPPSSLADWSVLLVGVAITIPFAAALHYAFERPLISYGRRLAAHVRTRRLEAAALA